MGGTPQCTRHTIRTMLGALSPPARVQWWQDLVDKIAADIEKVAGQKIKDKFSESNTTSGETSGLTQRKPSPRATASLTPAVALPKPVADSPSLNA